MSSSVKKDTINKHLRGLPDPRPGSGLCPVAGPAALRGGGGAGAADPGFAQIESMSSREGGAPDFTATTQKRKNNTTEKPEKTKTSQQNPHNPDNLEKTQTHGSW